MLQLLTDTNPAQIWLEQKFRISVLIENSEHVLVINFDLFSCGKSGFLFDGEKVNRYFRRAILADRQLSPIEYQETCEALADGINEEMTRQARIILSSAQLSFDVLDALWNHDRDLALSLVGKLSEELLEFKKIAHPIWSNWIGAVVSYINPDDTLKYG